MNSIVKAHWDSKLPIYDISHLKLQNKGIKSLLIDVDGTLLSRQSNVIPLINALHDFVKSGRRVLGICNGFQILTESGFLPGVLVANKNLNFICDDVDLNVITSKGGWFQKLNETQNIKLPIAHGEGRYHCDQETLKKLIDNDLIALKYNNNPNGSIFDIAGITNKKGNVLGLMPHPERACDDSIGGIDGLFTLKSLLT